LRRFILFLVAGCAFAAAPVASIKSSSDFQLSGVSVATAGVPSWPIMAGDTVVAGTTAATIRFMDGTMVTLAPYSQVAVQEKKDDLSLRLLNGFMSFTLAPSSALSVYSGATLVQAQPGVATTASVGASATSRVAPPPAPPAPPAPPTLSRH
jgi:ferric-dicitrate binding protein FerR (iron transport regulator)